MLPSLYGQLAAAQSATAANDPLVQATAAAALGSNTTTSTSANSDSITHIGSRDTTHTKIFVGGLPYHTTDTTLNDYFRQFGDIEEAVVITDRQTQKSRGYGFVTMRERADAEKACKDPNPIIDGRKANVNLAYLGAKPRNNVHLAALSNSFQQVPLQTQLAAQNLLTAPRFGGNSEQLPIYPPLYYLSSLSYLPGSTIPSAAGLLQNQLLTNPLMAQLHPSLFAALAQAQAQQNLAANQANMAAAVQQHQNPAGYFDYATLAAAAAAAQNNAVAYGLHHPAVSAASGLDSYGYALGIFPGATANGNTNAAAAMAAAANNPAYAAQLSAAQAQLAVAASGVGHSSTLGENQRI